MPTYDYACEKCGTFEFSQKITDEPLKVCPTCGSPVKRLISRNVNILFKGSGFYCTDSRKNTCSDSGSCDSAKPNCDSCKAS